MDLVLTGRWVQAAEALALGLVNRVCAEPDALASEIATDLARRDAGAVVKPVMAAQELLGRLQAERSANQSAWARVTGASPAVSPGQDGRLPDLEPGGLADAPAGRR
jgi:enoyl-CoA hydratase/carnithine racemase